MINEHSHRYKCKEVLSTKFLLKSKYFKTINLNLKFIQMITKIKNIEKNSEKEEQYVHDTTTYKSIL